MRLQGLGMRLLSEVEHLKTLADPMLVSLTHSTSLRRVETTIFIARTISAAVSAVVIVLGVFSSVCTVRAVCTVGAVCPTVALT